MAMAAEHGDDDPLCEINVTPMVDLLLCLLIIFIVSSSKQPNENIPMDVPKEAATSAASDPNATLLVKVSADGSAVLGTQPLSNRYDEMVKQFQDNEKAQTDGKIAIKGEGKVTYGMVVRIMAAAHDAGIADVGIASDKF